MTKLQELKKRIERNLKRNMSPRARGGRILSLPEGYREGYCLALSRVLERIEKMEKG
jgi:hypothetical protein